MKNIKIINKFNFNCENFINFISSKKYYKFLVLNDNDLINYNLIFKKLENNIKKYKIKLKYKKKLPDVIKKVVGNLFSNDVYETVTINLNNLTGEVFLESYCLEKLSATLSYTYKLVEKDYGCKQIITYYYESKFPIISSIIEDNISFELNKKNEIIHNLMIKFFNSNN